MPPRVADTESRAPDARSAPFLVVAMLSVVALCFGWQALAAPVLQASLPAAAFWTVQVFALLVATATAVAFARQAARPTATAGLIEACECERQLRTLAEGLPLGVLLVEDGRVCHANPLALDQLGHAGHGARDGFDARALFDDGATARAALDGDAPFDACVQLRRGDGAVLRAQVSASTIILGRTRRRIVLLADLTEGDRLAADLARQRGELQAMGHRLMTVQEDERRSLSRELHDDIGQSITAIKMCAMALADEDEARRLETIGEITGIADDTVAKLRNLSLLLRPPQLDALGLEAALRWQAGAMFRNGRPRIELDLARLESRPAHDVEQACFRIAQEAMTNALRHADAGTVTLRLRNGEGTLKLDIQDDGRGFDPLAARGLGLVTMRERAQQLGGDVWIEPAPDGGTRVRAQLPLRTAGDAGASVGDSY